MTIAIILIVITAFLIAYYYKNWNILLFIVPAFLAFIILLYIFSPKYFLPTNPPERNKIVFNSPKSEVKDSINVFYSLVKELSPPDEYYTLYHIDVNNNLCIDYMEFNEIKNYANNNDSCMLSGFKNFNILKLKRYIKLIEFLNKNHLSECDYFNDYLEFIYREYDINKSFGYEDDLMRFIYFFSDSSFNYDNESFKQLDRYDNILLLAKEDAKIWSK